LPTHTKLTGAMLLIISSLLGVLIALYHYVVPMTGVTGTAGALLVVISSALLVLGGVILLKVRTGGLAITIRVLIVLIGMGTIVAGWFLHEFWLAAVVALALLGVSIDFVLAKRNRK